MRNIEITHESDIPKEFGRILTARKKSLVWIREPKRPNEEFHLSWGDLTAVPNVDVVICNEAHPEGEYPIKIDEFRSTYEETMSQSGMYRKKEKNRLVRIPAGWTVTLHTREGVEQAGAGDWIAIDTRGCPYAQSQPFVDENLEFADEQTYSVA